MMMIAKVSGASEDRVIDPDERIDPNEAIKQIMPVGCDESIRKTIKASQKSKQFDIDLQDLNDFRVPVSTFKEYSVVMKGLNPEC